MDLNILKIQIASHLQLHLKRLLPHHSIEEVYQYALFPTGKLFRPLLAKALFIDLNRPHSPKTQSVLNGTDGPNHNLSYLCSFLEFHHTYSLLHDDLPCMDNDSMRRNRPTTHIAYGEWKALLIGDGLLNASYQILSMIKAKTLPQLFRFVTWCLGPKGLIQGQVLDLSEEMNLSFKNLLLTHTLKTSRLIQVALVGTFFISPLSPHTNQWEMGKALFRLGNHLGMVFQLLDDLTDLTTAEISFHEENINPFLKYPQESLETLENSLKKIENFLKKYRMDHLKMMIDSYYQEIGLILKEHQAQINSHLNNASPTGPKKGGNFSPISFFLNHIGS